jgi:hypothetical protein
MARTVQRRANMGEWLIENYGFKIECIENGVAVEKPTSAEPHANGTEHAEHAEAAAATEPGTKPSYTLRILFEEGQEKEVFMSLLQALQPKFNEAIKKLGKNPTAFAPPARTPRAVPPERQAAHAAAVEAENAEARRTSAERMGLPPPTTTAARPLTIPSRQQAAPRGNRTPPAAPSLARRPAGPPPNRTT